MGVHVDHVRRLASRCDDARQNRIGHRVVAAQQHSGTLAENEADGLHNVRVVAVILGQGRITVVPQDQVKVQAVARSSMAGG